METVKTSQANNSVSNHQVFRALIISNCRNYTDDPLLTSAVNLLKC